MTQDDGSDAERDRQLQMLHDEVRALRHLATLGRLAGGVAHDFNNQLTSILGYTDLLLGTAPEGELAHEDLLEIRRAAERATVITQQMLAFARPHAAQPGFVNLADILMDTVRLLRRVFGPDVQLTTSLPVDPVIVQADPVHIGHALLHLALHARDTLPDGGLLVFELSGADVERDTRSREAVSQTLAHLQVRTGAPHDGPAPSAAAATASASGAPAATPAALVRSETGAASPALEIVTHLLSENHAQFQIGPESETFTATLEFIVATADAQSVALRSTPPRGHETVMVVEDDAAVRTMMQATLERHGYRVMVAQNPRDALAVARAATPAVDLLIVDLVLPGGRGDTLAAELQSLRTGVRVLYISGQPDRLAADQPALAPVGILLAKPFTPNRLLLGVRQALDTTPPAAGSSAAS
jgi:two-component system cell cycle sensor histidine kinase/response regulator CckA